MGYKDADQYFKPTPYSLFDLFTKNDPLVIPPYQRSFSWGKPRLEALWNDILETEERNFNGFVPVHESTQKPHFLGAIVTEKPDSSNSEAVENVIDGQQRLTTTSIMLAVLCDFVEKMRDENKRNRLRTGIKSVLLQPYNFGTDPSEGRLKLNQENDFFVSHVLLPNSGKQRADGLSSLTNCNRIQERIVYCIKFFTERLDGHLKSNDDAEYDAKVERLASTLLRLVNVLHVSVRKPGLAYTIFETLNARGLDLTQADLIKNVVFRRGQEIGIYTTVAARWDTMQANLPDKDKAATEYIRHLYTSHLEEVKAGEVFITIDKYLEKNSVDKYSMLLQNESTNYSAVSGDINTGRSRTNELLEEINDNLKVTACYPLLLAGADVLGLSSVEFEKLTKITRDFIFRYFTVGNEGSPAKIEKIMGETARLLRSIKDVAKVADRLRSESPSQVFEADFSTFTARDSKMGFYIIRQIEISLAAGAGQLIPANQSPRQHLEHIMPQSPGLDWDHLKDDERYNSFINRIGNLLVLEADINMTIKNKSFKEKTGLSSTLALDYSKSRLILPNRVKDFAIQGSPGEVRWDFHSIEERQKALAKYALTTWSLA